jgi:hypothetical protein
MCYCDWVKATQDEQAYEQMSKTLKMNVRIGHYTTFGCSHTPPCQATKEQFDALNVRLKKDVYDKLEEERNASALEFDKDGKLIAALYAAGNTYRQAFMKDVELCLDYYSGVPGPSGSDKAPEYRDSILSIHIETMIKCLARLCKSRNDPRLFASLKEKIDEIEKGFDLAKKPDAEKT